MVIYEEFLETLPSEIRRIKIYENRSKGFQVEENSVMRKKFFY